MAKYYDVIIVGAGPAGSLAALKLARAGLNVCLLERGRHPGVKNMFGGLLHNTPALNELVPSFREKAPVERHVYKKILAFMTPESAVSLSFENENFDHPPYNGYTVLRPAFDNWLANRAVEAGALLLCDSTVDEPVMIDNRVVGVTVKGREGELRASIVIAADGVLSFLAEKVGLRGEFSPGALGVGVKLLLGLPETTINERFHLVRDQGADISFLGIPAGIRGGSFIYTNRDSLSVGMVMHLDSLRKSGRAPYEILDDLLQHPAVKKLIKGAVSLEYSAHLVPEGGYKAVPTLYTDGMMVVGDAAGLCYTNGINLEGINLAMTSGVLAAETAIGAIEAGDYSARTLSLYKKKLDETYVMKDMKKFSKTVDMMHVDRLYGTYPQILTGIMEKMYKVDGTPRSGIFGLARREAAKEVGIRNLVSDSIKIGRALL
jgi:electron transfer flavoprotein-quinone oxidoreductase